MKSSKASVLSYAIQSTSETYSTSIQRAVSIAAPNYHENPRHMLNNNVATSAPSPGKKNESRKQLTWHQSVIDALESHELRRSTANTKKPSTLTATRQLNIAKDRNISTVTAPNIRDVTITKGLVDGRKAIFERRNVDDNTNVSNQQQVDPAELSLKERFALFEKNKGTALIPKAALGMAPSAKQIAMPNAASSGTQKITQELQQIGDHQKSISLNLNKCEDISKMNDSKRPISSKADDKRHCDTNSSVNQSVLDVIEDVNRVSNADLDDAKRPKNDTLESGSIYPSLLGIGLDEMFETSKPYTETEHEVDSFSSHHGNDDSDDDDDLR